MEKIVITGMGAVTPLSHHTDKNVENAWRRLLNKESGIKKIEKFEVFGATSYCKIAGEIDQINIDAYLNSSEQRRNSRFIHHAVIASHQALFDAGLLNDWDSLELNLTEEQKQRFGVILGAGIGGIDEMYKASCDLVNNKRLTPFFVPSCLINLSANMVSIKYGLQGPSKAVVTACASSAHSIMDGYMLLQTGQVDYVLVGGSEASICPLGMEGFAAMNALAQGFNDTPEAGSRPYDVKRSGFVMGEGAGVLVLEKESHAIKRGAKIYAEIAGFGASSDADHITKPNHKGAELSIRTALKMAGVDQVGHINAHATSTPAGDASEITAFKNVFGDKLFEMPITANKSAIGHLLGAAGGVEAIFSILSMRDKKVPATLNLEELMPEAYIDNKPLLIKNEVQDLNGKNADYVLSTSFGFGGTNASLVIKLRS